MSLSFTVIQNETGAHFFPGSLLLRDFCTCSQIVSCTNKKVQFPLGVTTLSVELIYTPHGVWTT